MYNIINDIINHVTSLLTTSLRNTSAQVERVLSEALSGLQDDLEGQYYPLIEMTPEQEKQLIDVSRAHYYVMGRGLLSMVL